MCEECPLSLNAFPSTRPPKGPDGELHEIIIKSRGQCAHGPWYRAYSIIRMKKANRGQEIMKQADHETLMLLLLLRFLTVIMNANMCIPSI